MSSWGFYGRDAELAQLRQVLARGRWFFVKVTGRRRIGKTTLIQRALESEGGRGVFYIQIPDSGPAGVLSAIADAMDTFAISEDRFPRPTTLPQLANTVGQLARAGYVVALDEFQYFNRARLKDFCSLLQSEVDSLSSDAQNVSGGLLVLGSIHTEMSALLEDRSAPLFNRTTDELSLTHLDIASLIELLEAHADSTPERLLFLWNLFEGVPKFYRDCFEQEVIGGTRTELLERTFFRSSSPLRTEADNWFLKELHGRYDVVLKFIARNGGCSHGELVAHVRNVSGEESEQVGGYLKGLIDKYGLIEKKLPIFAKPKARKGRYYIADNFLRAWLAALANQLAALNFVPMEQLVERSNQRLAEVEGFALEKLVGQIYEECSRKGVGDFTLTDRVRGFWDRNDTEIDLVALDETHQRIRLGSCKRSSTKLVADLANFDGHIARFLKAHRKYQQWTVEKAAIAPSIPPEVRDEVKSRGFIAQDLTDLTRPLR